MADVFLARDRRLGRNVAIKAFRVGAADPAGIDAALVGNPAHDIERPGSERTTTAAGLSAPEVDALMDAADTRGPKTAALVGLLALAAATSCALGMPVPRLSDISQQVGHKEVREAARLIDGSS